MTQTTLPNRTFSADARIPALTFKTLRRYAAALGARRCLGLVLGMLALTPAFAADLILDNGTAQFSATGTWTPSSSVAGFEGSNYLYHNIPLVSSRVVDNTGGTATGTWWLSTTVPGYLGGNYQYHDPGTGANRFTWPLAVTGASYRVYARWTSTATRASNAVYTVRHSAGESPVTVNQQQNGGAWQLLGTYTLDANSQVSLSDAANGYVIADGVKAEPAAAPDTATWTAPLTAPAQYDVYAKWTANEIRARNAVYTVAHSNGESQVTVNQRQNGGQWNLLGRYTLAPGRSSVTLSSAEADGIVIADAIRLVPVAASGPTVSLTAPASGATFTAPANIALAATAADSDGTISKVEFYNGATLLGSATTPPYTATWSNVGEGSYSLTAKAIDNGGLETYSAAVNITVSSGAQKLYYLHTDHLDTPRLVTDEQNKVVWRNGPLTEPFGMSPPEEDPDGDGTKFILNLRFPGQYFDKETNTHYNYYRDYNPQTGRYLESDPIGLQGGINTYTYVNGNPLRYSDPTGEALTLGGVIAAAAIGWGGYTLWNKYSKQEACERSCPATCSIAACGDSDRTEMYEANKPNCINSCKTLCFLQSWGGGPKKGPTGPKAPSSTPNYVD